MTDSVPASATRIQVGIPWRPEPSRIDAFAETFNWYQTHGFSVVTGEFTDRVETRFNLSATRNHLIRDVLTSDVMVISDADTIPELEPLLAAIEGARADGLVHLPYHLYLDGEGHYVPGATSGVYVGTRRAFEATNGFDPRFVGWGYEDAAWRLAHLTLNGPIPRHRGVATAAGHDAAPRDRVSPNREIYRLYEKAYGDVTEMLEVVKHVSLRQETHQDRTARILERRAQRTRPLGAR
jgi:hypothetical protein